MHSCTVAMKSVWCFLCALRNTTFSLRQQKTYIHQCKLCVYFSKWCIHRFKCFVSINNIKIIVYTRSHAWHKQRLGLVRVGRFWVPAERHVYKHVILFNILADKNSQPQSLVSTNNSNSSRTSVHHHLNHYYTSIFN